MFVYRLYFFAQRNPGEERGRINRVEPIEAADDAHAISIADGLREGRYMELWERGRLVKMFEP